MANPDQHMPLTGVLRTWNEDRGFGFIAPTQGGRELFVHVSAFPRDGSRPVEGESLAYEIGRGRDGKPQAVRVVRQAFAGRSPSQPSVAPRRARNGSPLLRLFFVLLVLGAIAYGYKRLLPAGGAPVNPAEAVRVLQTPTQGSFRCDGRTYCSQMTSCAEATYFLKHCPGAKMDGNHDGVPCEQQWCD